MLLQHRRHRSCVVRCEVVQKAVQRERNHFILKWTRPRTSGGFVWATRRISRCRPTATTFSITDRHTDPVGLSRQSRRLDRDFNSKPRFNMKRICNNRVAISLYVSAAYKPRPRAHDLLSRTQSKITMKHNRILVALNLADVRDPAFERALALAKASGSELYLLHAVPANQPFSFRAAERLQRRETFRKRAEAAGVSAVTVEQHGDPAEIIVLHADARPVDFIVMGTERRTGWAR